MTETTKTEEKKVEKKEDKHGGGGGGGGMDLGKMWGVAILVIVIIFINLIGAATGQIGSFLQMIKFNLGPILIIAGLIYVFMATKK